MNDAGTILEQFGGEKDVVRSSLEAFLETCPELLDRIEEAITREDHGGLQRQAHSLKGAVITFSSGRALELVRELEIAGQNGTDFARIRTSLPSLRDALAGLRRELEDFLPAL